MSLILAIFLPELVSYANGIWETGLGNLAKTGADLALQSKWEGFPETGSKSAGSYCCPLFFSFAR